MTWQDIVLSVGGAGLGLALIPAIRSSTNKPPVKTSLQSAFWLTLMLVAAATLGLWLSAITWALEVTAYLILAGQRITWSSVLAHTGRALSYNACSDFDYNAAFWKEENNGPM